MTPGFWIILISFLIYGLIHSWLASFRVRNQARRRFGTSTDRWFRLIYNLIAFFTLLPILLLPIFLVDKIIYHIPYPWAVMTISLQVLSVFVLLYGLLQTGVLSFLGLSQVFSTTHRDSTKFVTDGLYRWVRHPLYTAGLLIIWLFPIMTCNLLALNIGMTVYIFIGALLEERKLEREFGEAYIEYKKHTPMIIPLIRFQSIQKNQS